MILNFVDLDKQWSTHKNKRTLTLIDVQHIFPHITILLFAPIHQNIQWYVKTMDLINPSRVLLSALPTPNVKNTVSQDIL